ncbi:MAG: YlmC/YmxH family sporulation protein [Bacillota bacterium]
MMRTSELTTKDVVDISNGQRLGEIIDIDIDLAEGKIKGIVIPKQAGLFNFLSKPENTYVSWDDIHKIGEDVILVKLIMSERELLD